MALYKGTERICPIISTGSPQPSRVEEKAVTFYDQNGDPVYSYDYTEAAALTELPEIPALEGYVGDCWNATLEDIHGLKAPHLMDIGPIYKVDLGNGQSSKDVTQVIFELPYRECELDIHFQQDVDGGVTIDWGDGSQTETVSGTGLVSATHTYEQTTDRIKKLRLTPVEDCQLILGISDGTDYCFMGIMNDSTTNIKVMELYVGRANVGYESFYYRPISKRIMFSNNNITFGYCAFSDSGFNGAIILPPEINVADFEQYIFDYCILKKVIFAQGNEPINVDYLFTSVSCERIAFPKNIVGGYGRFVSDYNPTVKIVDTYVNDPSSDLISTLEGLETIILGAESFLDYYLDFNDNYALRKVIFGSEVKELSDQIGDLDYNRIHVLHFGYSTQIVTAQSTTFDNIPDFCIFVVPDNLYDEWIQAEYWSDHADQIVKLSEYEELL